MLPHVDEEYYAKREILAKNLGYYLKKEKMSQTEFARLIGANPGLVNQWINQKCFPSDKYLAIMCDCFNETEQTLCGRLMEPDEPNHIKAYGEKMENSPEPETEEKTSYKEKINKRKRDYGKMVVSTNIKKLLKERNVSANSVAITIGVPAPHFYRWVSGKSFPEGKNLTKIATYFGVPVKEIVSSPEEPVLYRNPDENEKEYIVDDEPSVASDKKPELKKEKHEGFDDVVSVIPITKAEETTAEETEDVKEETEEVKKNTVIDISESYLKTLMNEKGISRNKLAKYLNVTTGTITNWCLGHSKPTDKNVKKICKFFGITKRQFFSNKKKTEEVKTTLPDNEERYSMIELGNDGMLNVGEDLLPFTPTDIPMPTEYSSVTEINDFLKNLTFGKRVSWYRNTILRMDITRFSELTGIAVRRIEAIEKYEYKYDTFLNEAVRIARAFSLSLDWLCGM